MAQTIHQDCHNWADDDYRWQKKAEQHCCTPGEGTVGCAWQECGVLHAIQQDIHGINDRTRMNRLISMSDYRREGSSPPARLVRAL